MASVIIYFSWSQVNDINEVVVLRQLSRHNNILQFTEILLYVYRPLGLQITHSNTYDFEVLNQTNLCYPSSLVILPSVVFP